MPSKLKKCSNCQEYNLTDTCRLCNFKTENAHYKFIKIKDAVKPNNFSN